MRATTRQRLWVGYSGGLDSTVLLDLLVCAFANQSMMQIAALHVHHGLNSAADDWVKHCQKNCDHLKIPLHILYVDAKPSADQSPEEAARAARFSAFKNFLGDADVLLLAHHQSDQAETILWRLFRGSGPEGLGGMSEKTELGAIELLRPLLKVPKASIEAYAKDHHLRWIEDPSNTDLCLDRNFLRYQILPALVNRWPASVPNINRSGALCLETAKLVEQEAIRLLATIQTEDYTLSVSALLQVALPQRYAVVRAWLKVQGYRYPSYDHMQRIDREILQAKPGARPRLKIGSYEITRQRDILRVSLISFS